MLKLFYVVNLSLFHYVEFDNYTIGLLLGR